eukprot:gene7622-13434_t
MSLICAQEIISSWDTVSNLLRNSLTSRNVAEQKLMVREPRPMPPLQLKTGVRMFQGEWPGVSQSWTETGYSNMQNILSDGKKHEKSRSHLGAYKKHNVTESIYVLFFKPEEKKLSFTIKSGACMTDKQNLKEDQIAQEVEECKFISIQSYETTDFSTKEQTYDGASVMSGHIAGVRTLVREEYPYACFFHCAAHSLNLVLCQSASAILAVKAQEKKTLKQTSIGKFFTKGKEPASLWNTVSNDVEEKKNFLNGNKVNHGSAVLKTPQRRNNASDSSILIPNSPAIVQRKRSLLTKKQIGDDVQKRSESGIIDLESNEDIIRKERKQVLLDEVPTSPVSCSKTYIFSSKKAFTNVKQFDRKTKKELIDIERENGFKNDRCCGFDTADGKAKVSIEGIEKGNFARDSCEKRKSVNSRLSGSKIHKSRKNETSFVDHTNSSMSRAYFASQPSKGKFTFGKESKKRSFEHDSSGISPLKKKLASKISALESQEISRKMHGELLCAEIPIDTVGESRVTSQASGKKEDEEVVKSSACNAVRSRKSLKLSKDISKKIRFTMTESSSQGRIGRSESKSNNVTCDGYLDEENDQDVIASYGCSKMNISKEVPSHEKENRGECHQEGLVDFVRNHGVAHDGIVDNDTANCSNDSFAELLEDFDMSIGNWELSSNQQVASNKGLANDSSHNT